MRLSTIQLISYFGAWFTNVAIYTKLLDFGVGAFIISIVASLHFLPSVIQAPFVGALIDRFDIKRLMLILLVVELVSTLSFLLVDSKELLWLLFITLYIRMSASSFYFTSEMSLLPKILKGDDLKLANEIHSIIWSVSYSLGMALSGIFVYHFGSNMAFLTDALLFAICIWLLLALDLNIQAEVVKNRIFDMIKEGFVYIKSNKKVLHLILLHSCVGLTAFDTLITLLADTKYKYLIATSLAIGFLNSIRAVALMLGPIFLSKFVNKQSFFYLLLFQGISIFIWATLQENFYLSLFGNFLTGIATTTLWSFTYTLLQEEIDSKFYGRVISYNDMTFMLIGVFTSLIIGTLAEFEVPLSVITMLIGSLFIITAFYYKFILNRVLRN